MPTLISKWLPNEAYHTLYAANNDGTVLPYTSLWVRSSVQYCCGLGELACFHGAERLLQHIAPETLFSFLRCQYGQWSFIYTLNPRQRDNSLHRMFLNSGAASQMGEPWYNENYGKDDPTHLLRTFRLNLKNVVGKYITAEGYPIPQQKEKKNVFQEAPVPASATPA